MNQSTAKKPFSQMAFAELPRQVKFAFSGGTITMAVALVGWSSALISLHEVFGALVGLVCAVFTGAIAGMVLCDTLVPVKERP